jgi:hypothetical protein
VVLGISIIGISAVTGDSSSSSEDSGKEAFGVLLIVASLVLQASLFTSEEIIMNKFHFEPPFVVGMEGNLII